MGDYMFHERIRELRNARKLSQQELANKLGVSKQSVSNWENNNIAPSIEQVIKISKFFHTSVDYILGLDDRKMIDISNYDDKIISFILQTLGFVDELENDFINFK